MDTARRLLLGAPDGAISTKAIAELSGISQGTLYRHFPTKDALLETLHEQHWESAKTALETFLGQARSDDLASFVRAAIQTYAEFFFVNAPLVTAFHRAAADNGRIASAHRAASQAQVARVLAAALRHVPHLGADAVEDSLRATLRVVVGTVRDGGFFLSHDPRIMRLTPESVAALLTPIVVASLRAA